ncbi:UDP-glucose 6-dehydrogenase [Caballeronia catudaia]|uniref:UDP-glucose 6-dehydrogenase n=1 Tax=Caballeronia catudaia TaxID=1777136 RepID=A0A158CAG6_9BURK|nr:UDP-glucose/GDP-mannose dehydrogenase family protein [Caballeronia catudaia]SAK79304.1 UDP-glucose 6-dehydrogenase [Caballeronia catudaia]
MKITIIGTGYVGLVTGACLAEIGNEVACIDIDEKKIAVLQSGGIPIHEPGLKELIDRNRAAGRLWFSTDLPAGVAHGSVLFIAVGTPPGEDGSADVGYVLAAARGIASHMREFKVIVNKSTVPVGTADRVAASVRRELENRGVSYGFTVVSNPEFLKEGAAIQDFMRPDRIVIGNADDEAGQFGREQMARLYKPFNRNHERTMYMDVRSAEFTKYAANSMLAARISFMNELSNLAERVGADIESVRRGIGSDPRIGYDFLYSGVGYGGSCFPKDVQALARTGVESGASMRILDAVQEVNRQQSEIFTSKITNRLGERLNGRVFAIWGLAFKPNTDDMREAPSRTIISNLLARGARVKAYDPVAMEEADKAITSDLQSSPDQLMRVEFVGSADEAAAGADALVIVTEWKEFKMPNFQRLRELLKAPLIFDGRNLYEADALASAGFEYYCMGRPAVVPARARDIGHETSHLEIR